jgi:hypothetical protein
VPDLDTIDLFSFSNLESVGVATFPVIVLRLDVAENLIICTNESYPVNVLSGVVISYVDTSNRFIFLESEFTVNLFGGCASFLRLGAITEGKAHRWDEEVRCMPTDFS